MPKEPDFPPAEPGSGLHSGFPAGLLQWHRTANRRTMPWKGERDPYKIWLSEIILQQTRVEQGTAYYLRFLEAFPTIGHLARASDDTVYKLWEGLGYYSRCRNLIHTARYIQEQHGGSFPSDYPSILALKGVGPYTAAAIASFAFNLPHAVLDGNVFRVLSRITGNDTPVDSTAGKTSFARLAEALLPADQAAEYNQAIMDFGASVCKPVPLCTQCFYQTECTAFRTGRQGVLPVKEKKTAVRARWFHYAVLKYENRWLLRQRTEKDIWQQLYEFLLLETEGPLDDAAFAARLEQQYGIGPDRYTLAQVWDTKPQRLSHQLIHFSFRVFVLQRPLEVKGAEWLDAEGLLRLPLPRTLQAVRTLLLR
ncbi:MAG TPA: A/G-specific adenine glycosylase [Chitinophagaceae bacterium]|jgi:A/G-specific adenine glycosylase|nr:A/G-specific adenine glycosylase [Chitinophagaceae bacterium]